MKSQTDRTYLVEGSFNASEIIASVLLPKQSLTSRYTFGSKAYNISKRISGNPTNAICFFMKKGSTTSILSNGDTYYQRVYQIDELIDHTDPDVLPFDPNLDECIVVVIHNPSDLTLVADAFDNLGTDYTSAQSTEPHIRINKKKDVHRQPRVLGVSIIRR